MRGALQAGRMIVVRPGIIPANAGSTLGNDPVSRSVKDHPRECGEHSIWLTICFHSEGSSPRMRGARGCEPPAHPQGGIIPANAGSTGGGGSSALVKKDHPRECGEHT